MGRTMKAFVMKRIGEAHGRGGLKRLLLGSVADKVLRGAATPVLVYRPVDRSAPAEK